jgi:hypothetical protein
MRDEHQHTIQGQIAQVSARLELSWITAPRLLPS